MESTGICHTVYPSRETLSAATIHALVAVNILVAITNISSSIFLIYALHKTKQYGRLSSRLISCLSASGCFVGALLQPVIVVILTKFEQELYCLVELWAQFIAYTFPQFSAVQIMIIAFDRFLWMKFPKRYRKYMTMKRATLITFFNFGLSVIIGVSSVIAGTYRQFYMFDVVLSSILSAIILMIFVIYTFTYLSTHHFTQSHKQEEQREDEIKMSITFSSPKTQETRGTDSIHALEKTVIFATSSTVLCYVPCLIVGAIWSYLHLKNASVSNTLLPALKWWSSLLMYFNSTISAVIFATRNAKIMAFCRSMRWRSKTQDSLASISEH